jgi:hypothetical protein
MDLGSIFLILGVGVFVAWYIGQPFFERRRVSQSVSAAEHAQSSLLAEREQVLQALQELDFDYALGKVPEEDYPTQRARLVQRGAEVLRLLDELHVALPAPARSAADDVEAALAERRARQAQPVCPEDDPIEAMLAQRRRARPEISAGFCPKCGKSVLKSDKFCPKCGGKLA